MESMADGGRSASLRLALEATAIVSGQLLSSLGAGRRDADR
jgi:hypothetical protein